MQDSWSVSIFWVVHKPPSSQRERPEDCKELILIQTNSHPQKSFNLDQIISER